MSAPFRVALVGCGTIAPVHLSALKKAGITPVALCDTVPEKAKALCESFGISPRLYTDYSEMLREERPDSVHLCTPHSLHAPMAAEALGMGINVLCEKPLAISEEQLNAVLNAAKESRAQIGVCLQNRYEPNILRMKSAAEQYGVEAAFGDVSWNRDAAYYRSGLWRGKWETEGGGVMINQALHTLDLLGWICGMPENVTAHIFNDHLKDEIEVEDTAVARFCDETGRVKFQLFASTAGGTDFPAHLRVKLKNGAVLHADSSFYAQSSEVSVKPSEFAGKLVYGCGHEGLIADFYRCIVAGEPFPIDAEEGAKVIRMILGIYRSGGKTVILGKETKL